MKNDSFWAYYKGMAAKQHKSSGFSTPSLFFPLVHSFKKAGHSGNGKREYGSLNPSKRLKSATGNNDHRAQRKSQMEQDIETMINCCRSICTCRGRRNRSRIKALLTCRTLFNFLCLFTVIAFVSYATIFSWHNYYPDFRILEKDALQGIRFSNCKIPKLTPFAAEIMPHLSERRNIICPHAANPSGEVAFRQVRGKPIIKTVGEVDGNCCYRPFIRNGDANSEPTDNCPPIKGKVTKIPVEHEFVEVICVGGSEDYRDGFAFVNPKQEVEDWLDRVDTATGRNENSSERLNVIVLGLDATSHMNFLRTMPESNKYLLQNLSAIVMNGYTKVAENTLPNVVPTLTGKTLEEFKETCVSAGSSDFVHLDNCPFIWKRFSAQGYRTSFAEDAVGIGIFNMNYKFAFDRPPTDYYFRPFSIMMERRQSSGDGYCYGTRLSFKTLLDNIENMAAAFKSKPYFSFTWSTQLSHDDFNKLSLGDEPLLSTLKYLNSSGTLNRTVLILMGDHGSRLDGIRSTPQGKLEDRMPLLYIVLPSWFKEKYPSAYKNLKDNSEKLTSPFDLYATLLDILDDKLLQPDHNLGTFFDQYSSESRNPQSLFTQLPENRTCFDAGIPLHWCTCQANRYRQTGENSEAQEAVNYAIAAMNNHLRSERWKCAELILDRILDAFYLEYSTKDTQTFDNRHHTNTTILRVSFITTPGHGSFEATLIKHNDEYQQWRLTEQVVRLNSYSGQSDCVDQEFKNFCYCI